MEDAQTIIARVGATIASTLTIEEVMSAVARQVCEAFDVSSAYSVNVLYLAPAAPFVLLFGFAGAMLGWSRR